MIKNLPNCCIYTVCASRTTADSCCQKTTLSCRTLLKVHFCRCARLNWTGSGILCVSFDFHVLSTGVWFDCACLYLKCLPVGSSPRSLWFQQACDLSEIEYKKFVYMHLWHHFLSENITYFSFLKVFLFIAVNWHLATHIS